MSSTRYSEKAVYLEISSWRGISIGAIHYYGKLVGYAPDYTSIRLKRTLNATSAKKLTEQHGDDYEYRSGYQTESFDTEEEVKKFAIKNYKKLFPQAGMLLLGNMGYREPHLVLDGSKEFKKKSKAMYNRCEELGWLDKGNEDEVESISDAWEKELEKEIMEL